MSKEVVSGNITAFESNKVYFNRKKNYQIIIREVLCKLSGLCVMNCPRHILTLSEAHYNETGYKPAQAVTLESCIGCYRCENTYPDLTIYNLREGKTQEEWKKRRKM